MREIKANQIKDKIKELFLRANYHTNPDLMNRLTEALKEETSEIGKSVLKTIIENNKIASREEVPICQDTGMAVVFVEVGQEVYLVGGDFAEAINQGVKEAYKEGYLRKSVVDDPVFERKNTKTNTPAIIYTDIVPGDKIKLLVMPKGFGSENMSTIAMLKPADGGKGIVDLSWIIVYFILYTIYYYTTSISKILLFLKSNFFKSIPLQSSRLPGFTTGIPFLHKGHSSGR
ncbi:unnamed protein product [marine sediment metagenome]|uniref:Fe-S hydro-lyase tartrate dehydratase alpha-type catalytic domain-containing protein n=1 Tax=marine sediment metagenome TaxID=412755 RepID=X1B5W5_9ZZZZ